MIETLLGFFHWANTAIAAPGLSVDDLDRDGFAVASDACPQVPGPDRGCPDIAVFEHYAEHDIQVKLFDTDNYYVVEKDEIRIGDVFSAGFYDRDTKQVYGESDSVEVTQ